MGRSVDRARRMEGGREGGRLSAGKGTADVTAAALHHHRYLDLYIYTSLCGIAGFTMRLLRSDRPNLDLSTACHLYHRYLQTNPNLTI